ncbi:MAG: hypothetical protein ACTSWC_08495 [Promethearchaeota archaeon]
MSHRNSDNTSSDSFKPRFEITPFSRYFYFILSLIVLGFIAFLVILNTLISWWYIFFILVPLLGLALEIFVFLKKVVYLRWSALGITVLGYIMLFLLNSEPFSYVFPFVSVASIVFIVISILIFIKNYNDTRFPFRNR